MLDALSLCEEEELAGRYYYRVDPTVMYPATISRFMEIKGGDSAVEVQAKDKPNSLVIWDHRIRSLPKSALELALTPRDEVEDQQDANMRAVALNTAWRFFKVVARRQGAKTTGSNNVLTFHLLNENEGKSLSDYRF